MSTSNALVQSQLTGTNNEFNQALSKQKGSALDKDAFMLLLVTQFKYQDPLNPMEDQEFIAQLAQFTSLEQMMQMNEGMTTLTQVAQAGQMINATSYIGKEVAATGTTISKETTKDADGNKKVTISSYRYAIADAMKTGSINVYDLNGQLVYSETLPARAAGTYTFTWDGTDFNGNQAPDGVYDVRLACNDAEGNGLQTSVMISGRVDGILTENGAVYLQLNDGRNVPLANVSLVGNEGIVSNLVDGNKKNETPDTDNGGSSGADSGTDDGGAAGDTDGSGDGGGESGTTGGGDATTPGA